MEGAAGFMATPTAAVRVTFFQTHFPTQLVLLLPRCCRQNSELGPDLLCDLRLLTASQIPGLAAQFPDSGQFAA